jgi:UDPglucose--hexose-1-phosphate uridylyltransferase
MKSIEIHSHFSSELRFDPVSKDWILIATGRAKRPEAFAKETPRRSSGSKSACPFCHFKGDWLVKVVPNKYPAFSPGARLNKRGEGPYQIMDGVGFAEVVVTRSHEKSMAQFSTQEIRQVLDVFQERYLDLMNEKFVNYVSIFHNHGETAGATISHPHSQIITHPIIDPDLKRSLAGSAEYQRKHKKCVHCIMLDFDIKKGQRIVFENRDFLVVCPFASRVAFETRIYPKRHLAYFERIKDEEKDFLAEAFKAALSKLYKALNNPDYNFFLHTAPCDGRNYDHYHWHFEILPKTSTWAGFELGTGIEISTIEPEKAAEYLRKM